MTSPDKMTSTSSAAAASASDPVLHQQLLNVKLVDAKILELEAMIAEAKHVAEMASAAVEVTMRQYKDKAKGKGKEKVSIKAPAKRCYGKDNGSKGKAPFGDFVGMDGDDDGTIFVKRLIPGWRGFLSDDATPSGSSTDNTGHSPSAPSSISAASSASLLSPPMLTPAETVASTATVTGMPDPAEAIFANEAKKFLCGGKTSTEPVIDARTEPVNNAPNRFKIALRNFQANEASRTADVVNLLSFAGANGLLFAMFSSIQLFVVRSTPDGIQIVLCILVSSAMMKITLAMARAVSLQESASVAKRDVVALFRIVAVFLGAMVVMKWMS